MKQDYPTMLGGEIAMKENNMQETYGFPRSSRVSVQDELRILASIGSGPKLIEEISSATKIPAQECRDKVDLLLDLGLVVVEHDSDLYGHELLKIRRASRLMVRPVDMKKRTGRKSLSQKLGS
jgi:hypothetical protein